MTISDMLNKGADTLQKAGIEEYGLDAWYLLSYCMGINRAKYYMVQGDEADAQIIEKYNSLIGIRAERKPLQQITGSQEFMGIEFEIDENVLIPRQDTEILVSEVYKLCQNKNVLDMCTGSGCIAISIAKDGKAKSVTACDISEKALIVAENNNKRLGTFVHFIKSDLWTNIDGVYDIIVSNPPYITEDEMKLLMPEVKEHEPQIALFGGRDGLDFYRRIINEAKAHLTEDGHILLEIGCFQAVRVSGLLHEAGFENIRVVKDLAGLDRVVMADVK
ncbi:MAG: peptide chain release factor N(5)-glutamine methyltransferase [Lachnoclostridium sp.]|nr:peptide chain release factor N(5)-glutamine methyltransferase [Lachnoclostridium sp.]